MKDKRINRQLVGMRELSEEKNIEKLIFLLTVLQKIQTRRLRNGKKDKKYPEMHFKNKKNNG